LVSTQHLVDFVTGIRDCLGNPGRGFPYRGCMEDKEWSKRGPG
jgi:hypothetical protein